MLSAQHEQLYDPRIGQHNGDSQSISHMPVYLTAFSKQQKNIIQVKLEVQSIMEVYPCKRRKT